MTMTFKKLVAVTPAKDEEHFIKKCITSVLNQKYPVTLHLIVDDGSRDKTTSIVENIISKTNKVKIISSSLKGKLKEHGLRPHLVQQIGINEITKLVPDWSYLLLLDGDCWIPPNYCEAIINKMEEDNRLAMVGARYLKTPQKIEKSTFAHVRSANHIIRREFYDFCSRFKRTYATLHGELLLERHAWIYGWKTMTIPIIAFCGRETGVTVRSSFKKGVYEYQLGTPLWLLILIFLKSPSKEKLLKILGWLDARVTSKPRFFSHEETKVLSENYKKQILLKLSCISVVRTRKEDRYNGKIKNNISSIRKDVFTKK